MNPRNYRMVRSVSAALAVASALALPACALAQPKPADPVDHSNHAAHVAADAAAATTPPKAPLVDEVTELRSKVAQLEAALQQRQMVQGGKAASGMGAMSPAQGAEASTPATGSSPAGGMDGMPMEQSEMAGKGSMPGGGGNAPMGSAPSAGGTAPAMGDMMQEMGAMMQKMGGMMNMKKGGMAGGGAPPTQPGAAMLAQSSQQGSQPPPGVDPATHAKHVQQGGGGAPAHTTPPAGTPAAPDAQPMGAGNGGDANKDLVSQIAQLRAEVAQLQAAVSQNNSAQPKQLAPGGMGMKDKPMGAAMKGNMSKGRMSPMSGMSGTQPQPATPAQPGGMAGMGGGAPAGGGAMAGGKDPLMMDKMQAMGMSRMGMGRNTGSMKCGLPGFPGASHLYHIGATGFFLDHGEHITLTVEQQKQLNQIKGQSLFNQATLQRKIEQSEQDLLEMTCSEAPDSAKIEAKAMEIAQAQAEQRIAFIRDVGKAATMLTDEQRKSLKGELPPQNQNLQPAPAVPMAPMKDM